MPTKIEWTKETWNPVVGCTKCSPGCDNCYAERMAVRLAHIEESRKPFAPKYSRVTIKNQWAGNIYCDESALDKPFHWRKPREIFVCSMSDLFHEKVPFEFIYKVWEVASKSGGRNLGHVFQFLTKRPQRALEFTQWLAGDDDISIAQWPLNCWLGVSISVQDEDWKVAELLKIPAAHRFVSVEPMLGPIELPPEVLRQLDQVIVGGESGPGARPMQPGWVRSIRDQCAAAGVPFFFKQWGGANKKKAGRLLDGQEHNDLVWRND